MRVPGWQRWKAQAREECVLVYKSRYAVEVVGRNTVGSLDSLAVLIFLSLPVTLCTSFVTVCFILAFLRDDGGLDERIVAGIRLHVGVYSVFPVDQQIKEGRRKGGQTHP